MARQYSSTAVDTTLSAAITSTDTTMTVAATTGFPVAPFTIAIVSAGSNVELALVTGVNGTTLTVTRGYDSTVAAPHSAGDVVRHSHAAIDFREAATHIESNAAHGATGAVVGTTNTQTLTNKNLASSSNTFPTWISNYLVPTGAGMEWYSHTPPAGYLMQDNGEYPIATYPDLYNFLTSNGTTFPHGANTNGAGLAGTTHFRTPDHKGRTGVGYDATQTEFNALGKIGGAKTHALFIGELPAHTHTINHAHAQALSDFQTADHTHTGYTSTAGDHNHGYVTATPAPQTASGSSNYYTGRVEAATSTGGAHSHTVQTYGVSANHQHYVTVPGFSGASGETGLGTPHNNLQPYLVVNYIIKT